MFALQLISLVTIHLSAALVLDEAEDLARYQRFVDAVGTRVLAAAHPAEGLRWPPRMRVVTEAERGQYFGDDRLNAHATYELDNGLLIPVIRLTEGIMKEVVEDDSDRLALLLGHELAHHLLGHTSRLLRKEAPAVLAAAFTREQELDADALGAELALNAGYSLQKGALLIRRLAEKGGNYCSLEALMATHPSPNDRLAEIDKRRQSLWKSMSAFDNGVLLLDFGHYRAAESCFLRVTTEFPSCSEAWGNLGYSRLMQYVSELSADEVANLEIGEPATHAFDFVARSLERQARGDTELWAQSVAALDRSIEIQPALPALCNRALAELLRPTGKNMQRLREQYQRITQSDSYQKLAGKTLTNVADSSAAALACILNVGLLIGAQVDPPAAQACAARLRDGGILKLGNGPNHRYLKSLAMQHFALTAMRAGDPSTATQDFEQYFEGCDTRSKWHDYVLGLYRQACAATGRSAKSFQAPPDWQPQPAFSVTTHGGIAVSLSQPIEEVLARVPSFERFTLGEGTKLTMLRSRTEGISLLADQRVIAIILSEANSPVVEIRNSGAASSPRRLHVGMSLAELNSYLGEGSSRLRSEEVDVFGLGESTYFPELGISIERKGDAVVSITLVMIPTSE